MVEKQAIDLQSGSHSFSVTSLTCELDPPRLVSMMDPDSGDLVEQRIRGVVQAQPFMGLQHRLEVCGDKQWVFLQAEKMCESEQRTDQHNITWLSEPR